MEVKAAGSKLLDKITTKEPEEPSDVDYNTVQNPIEDDRTTMDVEGLKRAYLDNLFYLQGRFPEVATAHDRYMALAYTVRDRLLQSLDQLGGNVYGKTGADGRLSLRRVSAGPTPDEQPAELGHG